MVKKINIEKILDYNYFLILTSFIIFIDTYLIFFLEISIININIDFLKSKIGHIFLLILLYAFTMAIVSKVVNLIINSIYEYKFKNNNKQKVDRTDYMFSNEILNISIEKNNSVLYNYYLEDIKVKELIYKNQYLSTAVIIILISNFLVSTDTSVSLMKIYELFFNNKKWYYIFVNIIPLGTIIYIAYSILNIGELYYTYLPKYIQDNLLKNNDGEKENAKTE